MQIKKILIYSYMVIGVKVAIGIGYNGVVIAAQCTATF